MAAPTQPDTCLSTFLDSLTKPINNAPGVVNPEPYSNLLLSHNRSLVETLARRHKSKEDLVLVVGYKLTRGKMRPLMRFAEDMVGVSALRSSELVFPEKR